MTAERFVEETFGLVAAVFAWAPDVIMDTPLPMIRAALEARAKIHAPTP